MAKLKAGTRMRSAVGTTEVVLVAVPEKDLELTCGGAPMIGISEEPPAGLSISADGAALTLRTAKALPSSD